MNKNYTFLNNLKIVFILFISFLTIESYSQCQVTLVSVRDSIAWIAKHRLQSIECTASIARIDDCMHGLQSTECKV